MIAKYVRLKFRDYDSQMAPLKQLLVWMSVSSWILVWLTLQHRHILDMEVEISEMRQILQSLKDQSLIERRESREAISETSIVKHPPTNLDNDNIVQSKKPNYYVGPWTDNNIIEKLREVREKQSNWILYDPKYWNETDSARRKRLWENCATYACSKDEERCFNTNATDFTGDQNNPPCCSHLLRDMMFEVGEWLQHHNVSYWAHFGTLLGIIRDNAVFSWTADVDIAVWHYDWNRLANSREAKYDAWDKGYLFFDEGAKERYMGRMCFHEHYKGGILKKWPKKFERGLYVDQYLYMDIYLSYTERTGIRAFPIYDKFPVENMLPIQNYPFSGKHFPVPAKPRLILEQYYTADWVVRKESLHGHRSMYKKDKKT